MKILTFISVMALAVSAQAATSLFDFENPSAAVVDTPVPGKQGFAIVTNMCATSGSKALWMGPLGGKAPAEGFSFAVVRWTDPALNDWSRFDRLTLDVTNLSSEDTKLVFYLYDKDMKKRKEARFSFDLPNRASRRVEIALDWKSIVAKSGQMRGIAFVHCSAKFGEIVIDRITLLEKGDVPPPVPPRDAFRKNMDAFRKRELNLIDAFNKELAAKEAERIAEMKREMDADVSAQSVRLAEFLKKPGVVCGGGRVALAQATGMQQIRPRQTDFSKLAPATGVNLRLSQGEYEGALIAVASADGKILKDVRISVEGNAAAKLKVEISPVGYVFADVPTRHRLAYCEPSSTNRCGYIRKTRETPLGWYADPILPFLKSVDVAPGDVQSFHVRVQAPETCPRGRYAGRLLVKFSNAPDVSVPLNVRVNGYKVGKVSELPLLASFTPYVQPLSLSWTKKQADEVRNDPEAPVNLWKRQRFAWADFLVEYFIVPATIYPPRGDTIPNFDLVQRAAEKGRYGYFTVGPWSMCENETEWRLRYLEPLKKRAACARAAGLGRWMVTYGCDETESEYFPAIRRALDILKRELPDVPIVTTACDSTLGVDSALAGVDWFVPLTKAWNPEKVAASRAKGHKVWWYVACGEVPPYANMFVQSPLSEGRLLMGAQALRMKPDGFLYYSVSKWNHKRPITSGPFTDWSPHGIRHRHKKALDGDGVWAYCGPEGMPIATLRLENFRDGVEDYNCAKVLERLLAAHADKTDAWSVEARAMLDVPLSVMESMSNFTDDPDRVYAWRWAIDDLIEQELESLKTK